MKLRHIYLLLFVLGTILPYSQFIPWFLKNGLDLPLFFTELFSTKIGSMFGMDLFVSAAVLFVFTWFEAARLKMRGVRVILTAVFFGDFFGWRVCRFSAFSLF